MIFWRMCRNSPSWCSSSVAWRRPGWVCESALSSHHSVARLVIFALAANFVIAPAIALALTEIVTLDRAYAIGLLLLGGAAGAPFLPKLAELARGDFAFSVGLMLSLLIGSVVYMPMVLPLLIPGLSPEPWPLLRPLLFTMLLPLAAGMFLRSRSETWSAKLRPLVGMLSNVSLILTVLLLIGLNFTALLGTFGSGAAAVGVLFVSLSVAIGCALGGPAQPPGRYSGWGPVSGTSRQRYSLPRRVSPTNRAWSSCFW